MPQPAIDLGQMRENRADTARDFRDRVTFFSINLVGSKSQPLHRNATAGGIGDKRIDLLPELLLLRCQAAHPLGLLLRVPFLELDDCQLITE